jgi:asparagine synthetase B (glutamine-hydrolysing)
LRQKYKYQWQKKLKILHAAVSMNPSSGVVKQMEWEQKAAQELDINWLSVLHTPVESTSPIVRTWQSLPNHSLLRYMLTAYLQRPEVAHDAYPSERSSYELMLKLIGLSVKKRLQRWLRG